MPILQFQAHLHTIDPAGRPILAPPAVGLQMSGPIIQISIGLARVFAQQLVQQGLPVPAPISGHGLIDTGAVATCIDDAIALQLGLPAIDVTTLSTASQPQSQHNVYPASIEVMGSNIVIDASRAIGVSIASQGVIALIGRDVLQHCLLIYNGTAGQFTMALG